MPPIANSPPISSPLLAPATGAHGKSKTHLSTTASTWKRLQTLLHSGADVVLDGNSLSIADVVAVAQ